MPNLHYLSTPYACTPYALKNPYTLGNRKERCLLRWHRPRPWWSPYSVWVLPLRRQSLCYTDPIDPGQQARKDDNMRTRDLNTLGDEKLYDNLAKLVGPGMFKNLANNTFVWRDEDDDSMVVTLHHTDIVRVAPNGDVTLRSGGYETVTTKQRLNALLPAGVRVSSNQRIWYVTTPFGSFRFLDGMTLGGLVNPAADYVNPFGGLEADRLEDVRVSR